MCGVIKMTFFVNNMIDIFTFSSQNEKLTYILGVSISSVIIMLFISLVIYKINRKFVLIFNLSALIAFIVSAIFRIDVLTYVILGLILFANFYFIRTNDGEFRKFVAKPLKKTNKNMKEKKDDDKNVDMQKLISNLVIAVNWLSRNKVGALITFEKGTPLDNYIKSGTIINCPFTPELVETIFYEGTRLHDGAIVIRNGIILAAAVYYTPSTKAVIGKFGARHRAALGISEVSDSITVIVSEETGRIAIAHNGMLDNVKSDEFEKLISMQLL